LVQKWKKNTDNQNAVSQNANFINRSTEAHASPVTVDVSPPEVTKESILVSGRILANISQVEAW
jgi:hypothetical protein